MPQLWRISALCLLLSSAVICSAQSWKDLAAKAKQKAKDAAAAATGQIPANGQDAPTATSASGTTAAHGRTGYTFCLGFKGATQRFVSEVFPWGNGQFDHAGTEALSAQWNQYVVAKFAATGYPGNCEDPSSYPTEALALKRKTEVMTAHTSGSPGNTVVQTGWTPAGAAGTAAGSTASVGEGGSPAQAERASYAASGNSATKNDIDQAQPMVKLECERSALLVSLLDCDCMADKVYAARLKGPTGVIRPTTRSGHGPKTSILTPELGDLIQSLDLRSCTTKARIDAYSAQRSKGALTLGTMTPDRQSAMTSCVKGKFEAQVEAEPRSLTDIALVDRDFLDNFSSCNQALR